MFEITGRPAGAIKIPPSKSVLHRAIIVGALQKERSAIENYAPSEDVLATIDCVKALGAKVEINDSTLHITPITKIESEVTLPCRESGSTLRFLAPVAEHLAEKVNYTGAPRLFERGKTKIEQLDGVYNIPGDISSQYISGLLFLKMIKPEVKINIIGLLQSKPYVDLTSDIIENFKSPFYAEGDYSGAAFFIAAKHLGCDIELVGLNPKSLQGDRAFESIIANPPSEIDVSQIPDLVPPLAAYLALTDGTHTLTNAARLRIKECDRLSAVATELNRLGGKVEEGSDFLRITGVNTLRGANCKTWGDHRIAMMLAVCSLRCKGAITLDDEGVVSKSFPNFWELWSTNK